MSNFLKENAVAVSVGTVVIGLAGYVGYRLMRDDEKHIKKKIAKIEASKKELEIELAEIAKKNETKKVEAKTEVAAEPKVEVKADNKTKTA